MAELRITRDGGIATIWFDNVPRHNAVTFDMWCALPERLKELEADDDVRVIMLAGAGEKAFISGADISQFDEQRGNAEGRARYNEAVEKAYEAPILCKKPVVAKIRGICMGGGLGLAAACDVRIASQDAVFRMPAARLGLGYNFVGIRRFMGVIGAANTADIFFSARKFDAQDALRMGFVSRVVANAELDREVVDYCGLLAENAPMTIAAAKLAIREAMKDPAVRDLAAVERMVDACFASADYVEGRSAFMAKRKPEFKGR